MFQSRNRHWGVALTVVSTLSAMLLVSACTPPMPPDVLAAQLENQITCQEGSQEVAVPEEFMGSFDIVNVTLNGVCPEQSVTETTMDMPTGVRVTSAAPTTIEMADFTEQCTGEVITVPVFNYGVTLSYNIIGLGSEDCS